MTCVHRVKWSVKRPENCRFRLSVSHYKDRIVAPDEYSGATVVTPSDSQQVLATKDKLVRDDITVLPAPTEYLSTDHNGTFTPSSGKVGFYQVNVDVNPDLRPLSVSENGTYSPDGFDGYSRVDVDVPEYLKQYLIAEGVEDTARNDIFCNYWTEKYVPVRDTTRYAFYIIQVENNTAETGIHWLFYGLRDNSNIVIAVRANPYRLIDVSALDSKTYNLYVSAGAIVRVYAIPKITS